MSTTIEWFTSDELRARRTAMLAQAQTTIEDLRAKRDSYLLDLDQQALLADLEDIDYLLDGD